MRNRGKRAEAAGTVAAGGGAGKEGAAGGDGADDARVDAAERLTVELARLRAKFGGDPAVARATDPSVARASFDAAWMSPTAAMEEDEAEFIDAVADCMGAGLSLDAALACWDGGGLCCDGDAEGADDDDDVGESGDVFVAEAHHGPIGARRRLLMT